jgi:hypothetical protein
LIEKVMQLKNHNAFELSIEERPCPLRNLGDASAQIWHDYDGNVCAYAYTTGTDNWLHFPNIATYRIDPSHDLIVAYPERSAVHDKILDIFARVVIPIAMHVHGTEVLHASAVRTSSGIAAFCAVSETGKSTTAFALSQRGYQHWADDAVPFEVQNGHVQALPLPFGVRLSPDAEEYLGHDLKSSEQNSEDLIQGPLCVLFVLKRAKHSGGKEVNVTRLSPARAFRSVLLHAHFFNLKKTNLKHQMVSNYMRLTSLVPVFEVEFHPGFEKLPLLLDELERVMREPHLT